MPYIDKVFRERLDQGAKPVNTGELNYKLTRILRGKNVPANAAAELMLLECRAYLGDNPSYGHFNDVVGAVVCALQEFVRRVETEGDVHLDFATQVRATVLAAVFAQLDPYEDKKRLANGDVA